MKTELARRAETSKSQSRATQPTATSTTQSCTRAWGFRPSAVTVASRQSAVFFAARGKNASALRAKEIGGGGPRRGSRRSVHRTARDVKRRVHGKDHDDDGEEHFRGRMGTSDAELIHHLDSGCPERKVMAAAMFLLAHTRARAQHPCVHHNGIRRGCGKKRCGARVVAGSGDGVVWRRWRIRERAGPANESGRRARQKRAMMTTREAGAV